VVRFQKVDGRRRVRRKDAGHRINGRRDNTFVV
jgi:hypothetical protein